jgi:hypothetical protein
MDYYHLVSLIKSVLCVDWEPNITPGAMEVINLCDSTTEKLYFIGAAYSVEKVRNKQLNNSDDSKMLITDCTIEYEQVKYRGIWFSDPWFGWYEHASWGPSACAFVPQLKFRDHNYHHDFGLFYNCDNGGCGKWNLAHVIEIDPDFTHTDRKEIDAYRDSIVDYDVVRICENIPSYLTWFTEIIKRDEDEFIKAMEKDYQPGDQP